MQEPPERMKILLFYIPPLGFILFLDEPVVDQIRQLLLVFPFTACHVSGGWYLGDQV